MVFRGLTHLVDPLLPLAGLGLAGAALAGSCGWRPQRAGHLLIACCFAVLVSYAIKEQLKFDFGRLWPETWVDGNPSWIKDAAYGFFPFHGRTGWSSFPSGHMTAITAPVSVLWARLPRWRPVLAIPVILVAVGLYGADFHFIGDMVAGCCLGAACGIGVLAVLRRIGRLSSRPTTDDGRFRVSRPRTTAELPPWLRRGTLRVPGADLRKLPVGLDFGNISVAEG